MPSVTQMYEQAVSFHKVGNLHQAELLYRQILQVEPHHIDALHLFGLIAHQVGRNDVAVDMIRHALRLRPAFPAAHSNLGNVMKAMGRLEEAISHYRQAIRFKSDYAEAYSNLGTTLLEQGKHDEAIANYRQAIRFKPDYAEAYSNLGNTLRVQGRFDEAIANCQQAVRLRPDYAEAYSNLGSALMEHGRFDEAIATLRHALNLNPTLAEAYCNLGMTYKEQGRFDEAITDLQHALRLKPIFAAASNNLGIVFLEKERLDEAVACFHDVLRHEPTHAAAHNNLANALQEQGKLAEAYTSYMEALRLKPDFVNARWNCGTTLQQLGDFAGAEKAYRDVLLTHPRHGSALGQLAILLRGKLPQADRAILEQSVAEPNLTESDRSKLLFGLAQVCDANGDYEQAARHLSQANALVLAINGRRGESYRVDGNARLVDNIKNAFHSTFFERIRGLGLETERPVFIVGLPRSGTTLTEQILAAHSQVFGAGELHLGQNDFQTVCLQPTDQGIFAATQETQANALRLVGQHHLDQLKNLDARADRIVDKMPDNYLYLGLLAALFPRAKFIHCRRDLRDVAVSCWMTNFRRLNWTNHLEHIASRFRDYHRVMEHWRAVLPVPLLEVHYEETVTDFASVAERLVAWCGLDWEPACLTFHEGMRPIRTASATQARQPVYTRSVGRWRHYEQALGPLFAALTPLMEKD